MNLDDLRPSVTISSAGGIILESGTATTLPAEIDLVIPQGGTWTQNITWRKANSPVDLSSGYTAVFDARKAQGGTALVALTESSGITLGPADPNIILALTAAQTAALNFVQARYSLVVTKTSPSKAFWLATGLIRLEKWAGA